MLTPHSPQVLRSAAPSGNRDQDYWRGRCACGWVGVAAYPNRTVEGRTLAERDAVDHVRSASAVQESVGPGRPRIGEPIQIRLPADLLEQVDQLAADAELSRGEVIRSLLKVALVPGVGTVTPSP